MSKVDDAALKLRTVLRLLIRRAYAATGGNGPARSEQGVLARLEENGEMTPGALAAAERVRPQTMGQTLDSLDRRRWIRRAPHPGDRRKVSISLSPAGRRALTTARELRQTWLAGELRKLKAGELRTVVAGIDILERFISDDGKHPAKGPHP